MKRATDEIQRIEMMDAVERGREETRERRDLVFRVRLNSTFYLFQIYFSLAGSHFLDESRVCFSFENDRHFYSYFHIFAAFSFITYNRG
jgi:hypothetical protein